MKENIKVVLRPVYNYNKNHGLLDHKYHFDHYEIYGKVLEEHIEVREYQATDNTNLTYKGAVVASLMNQKLNKDLQEQSYRILNQEGKEEVVILSKLPYLVNGIGEVKPGTVKSSRTSIKDPYVDKMDVEIITNEDGTIHFE